MFKKRIIGLFLVVILITPITVFVGQSNEAKAARMGINTTYVSSTSTSISIPSSGIATGTCDIISNRYTTTNVSIYAYLQQKVNGSWVSIDAAYGQYDSYTATLFFSSSVVSGYEYRIKSSFYAFSGSDYENVQSYSGSQYY